MVTIATPTITQQANGSFAENTNEIDTDKIAASYHETECYGKLMNCKSKSIINYVTAESINL